MSTTTCTKMVPPIAVVAILTAVYNAMRIYLAIVEAIERALLILHIENILGDDQS